MRPWMIPWLFPLGLLATVASFALFGDRAGLVLLVGLVLVAFLSALRLNQSEDDDPDADVHYWRLTDWVGRR